MWRDTEFVERNRKIFEEELDAFVPRRVFDAHVHVYNEGVCRPGEPSNVAGHPVDRYEYGDLFADYAAVLPGREVKAVCFGSPNPDRDNRRNDEYVASAADRGRVVPFRLLDPAVDTPESLERDVAERDFRGLKPYLRFVRDKEPDDVEIPDMLPDWAMDVADRRGLAVTLHVPRAARLADASNQEHVVRLAKRFPKARIIVAHIGRAYFLRNVLGNLDAFAAHGNLYLDLAMVQNPDVFEHAFERFPLSRILFASDAPIAFAPGKAVEINHQYSYVTPVPWELAIHDAAHRIRFTSFLYEELRAIAKAVERLALDEASVRAIFHDNASTLFGI